MSEKTIKGTWLEEAKKNAGFLIFLGFLTVVFGVLAIGAPLVTGIAVAWMVGFLLVAMGLARIAHTFKAKQWGTGIWGTVIGLLSVAGGVLMLARPLLGLASMTLLLAIYLVMDGVCEIIAAFKIRPDQGWGWVLFNGAIAVVLGFMIWRQWPISGAWAIGLLVGIHILMSGWAMIVLGTGARRFAGAVEDVVDDTVDDAEGATEKFGHFTDTAIGRASDLVDDAVGEAKDVVDKED
jgi:uncharacterized membrane protein HdeD (DUF308 family)